MSSRKAILLEVREQLNTPQRTFQRYVSEAFIAERQLLAKRLTDDEVLNQLAILEARLSGQRRDLLAMGNDKELDAVARIKAHTEASTLAITIYNIYCDAVVEVLEDRASRFSSDRDKPKIALWLIARTGLEAG